MIAQKILRFLKCVRRKISFFRLHKRTQKLIVEKSAQYHVTDDSLVPAEDIDAFWKPYTKVDPRWANCYAAINGIRSPLYVPSDIWFGKVCAVLERNERFGDSLLRDKNYLDLLFPEIRKPEVVVRNINGTYLDSGYHIITEDEAFGLCESEGEVVIKPSIDSSMARNIDFLRKDGNFRETLKKNFHQRKNDFVVQRVLCQNSKMAVLNQDSINTVRILSLLWKNEVYILGALVRIGVKGVRVDNPHASNGVSCVLDENGCLTKTAFDREWNKVETLPNGIRLEGYPVSGYANIVSAVKKYHSHLCHSRLVGWDFTFDEDNNPILIETNIEEPEIYFHQIGSGPIIKDPELLRDILNTVF